MIHTIQLIVTGAVELAVQVILGNVFGVSHVIRYLRNPHPRVTAPLLRAFGASVGEKTVFKGAVLLDNVYQDMESKGNLSNLKIGNNCYIGESVYFDLVSSITIMDNAVISGKVSFLTHADCGRSEYLAKKYPRKTGAVTVEDGAWIGFGAVVLAGADVGGNSVIGACALVTKGSKKATVSVGIPAKAVKPLE